MYMYDMQVHSKEQVDDTGAVMECIYTPNTYIQTCTQVHSKKQLDDTGAVMECTGKLHLVDLAGSECAKTAGQEDPKVCMSVCVGAGAFMYARTLGRFGWQ